MSVIPWDTQLQSIKQAAYMRKIFHFDDCSFSIKTRHFNWKDICENLAGTRRGSTGQSS